MRRARRVVMVLVVALTIAGASADDPAMLLEEGIYAQQTAGELDRAIRLYKQVIRDGEGNPRFLAEAHYRLGTCYLGKNQEQRAAEQFLTVLRDFPDQAAVAERAAEAWAKAMPGRNAAPTVLHSSPKAFADDVSPTLDRITVTFDRRMMDGSWSWTGGGETFPQVTGKPGYDRARMTCTLPVKLAPGKVYRVGINSPSHKNFKTADGLPARRHVILFATADRQGNPTAIPPQMVRKARAINDRGTSNSAGQRPVVLKTVPEALEASVSPGLDALRATFDRRMMRGSWSWTGGGETFPETTGQPYYDSVQATCKLPVELEPGKVYRVGINSPSHKNFKTPDGTPARRYVILFATAGPDGEPTPIPEEMAEEARQINAQGRGEASPVDVRESEDASARGWKLWRDRKLPEAEERFDEAVVKNPENVNAWNGLGWARLNQGRRQGAQEAFERCIELQPTHPAALNGLGWLAKGRGETREAIEHWKKAVEAAPGATAALNGLTTAYMESGEYEKAARYYEMWLKVEPNSADAKRGLQKAREKAAGQ